VFCAALRWLQFGFVIFLLGGNLHKNCLQIVGGINTRVAKTRALKTSKTETTLSKKENERKQRKQSRQQKVKIL